MSSYPKRAGTTIFIPTRPEFDKGLEGLEEGLKVGGFEGLKLCEPCLAEFLNPQFSIMDINSSGNREPQTENAMVQWAIGNG